MGPIVPAYDNSAVRVGNLIDVRSLIIVSERDKNYLAIPESI